MSKTFSIKKTKVMGLKIPLNQPFRIATGTHDILDNVLFQVELGEGTVGYGEAAVAGHITGESLSLTKSNLRDIGAALKGLDCRDIPRLSAMLHEIVPDNPCAVAAAETALLDALTRQLGWPLWKYFGTKAVVLQSDITIVIADLAETIATTKKYYRRGFRKFKIKIGKDYDLDVKRVVSVCQNAPLCPIILDANQGFNEEQILDFIKDLQKQMIVPALLEQPVPKKDWEGLKRVTRLTKIPVCADESVGNVKEALRAIHEKAVDVINIKFMKSGVIQGREIALLTKAAGLKLMIGAMMESPIAIFAAAHFTAGLGGFKYIDLDTPYFLKNFRPGRLMDTKGRIDVRKANKGLGIRPSGGNPG